MGSMKEHAIWNASTGITDISTKDAGLGDSRIPGIQAIWTDTKIRLRGQQQQLTDFTEKMSREWAIETGIIENLYDIERGVTQTLIEHGLQSDFLEHGSTNKPREHVIQLIRDQKDALDGIFAFVKDNRDLSESYIKELHSALLRSQDTTEAVDSQGRHVDVELIKGAYKKQSNHPVREGIKYTYCPPEQVDSEMGKLIAMYGEQLSAKVPPDVRAAWLHHRFTQIHPFQDGNGRVARAIASLVLIKDGLFPLVVNREDKPEYLEALEAADGGDIGPLVKLTASLQMRQWRRAISISDAILVKEGVTQSLQRLDDAAARRMAEIRETFKSVFEHASIIEANIYKRLEEVSADVEKSLRNIDGNAKVVVNKSGAKTDYYFRTEIIKNAKKWLNYFFNPSEYRSWIALNMTWSRRAKLVFAIHGIGKPFNGSLICAPFLQFKDQNGNGRGQQGTAMVPVAEEGFIFFYKEDQGKMLERFRPWREEVINIAIKELTDNL